MQNKKQKKEVSFGKRWIQPYYQKEYYTTIRLEREGKLINPRNYKEGDTLYILKYHKKGNFLKVGVYEIINKGDGYDIKEIDEYKIWYINEIYSYNFSEELQKQILNFYKGVGC